MSDDHGLIDAERLQQLQRIGGHIGERVRNDGFCGAAETDLVRNHDAESYVTQDFDRGLPILTVEVHSMEQDYGVAVRCAGSGNIHVSHSHILVVQG